MKNSFVIIILFLGLSISSSFSQGLANPSACYVELCGYKYDYRKDSAGNDIAVAVFPDGSVCNAWAFYRGECGKKYSYCALKGCDTKSKTENKEGYKIQYAVCCCTDTSGIIQEIPLNDFIEQHGDKLCKSR